MTLSSEKTKAILAVASELHIGKAAKRLGTTQPYLSTRLRLVENELGIKLFERRPRVTLTLAGQILVEALRREQAEIGNALHQARLVDRGKHGRIVVGIASTAMLTGIPALVGSFRQQYPEVMLDLRDLNSARQAALLETGGIDVGITREPSLARGMNYPLLLEERFVAVIPSYHREAHTARLNLRALASEPFVLFRREVAPKLHDQIFAACAEAGFVPQIVQEADEWYTVLAFVRTGAGVSIGPGALNSLSWTGIRYRQLVGTTATVKTYVCWNGERCSPVSRQFTKFLLQSRAALRQ